jgi:hypothetical protein
VKIWASAIVLVAAAFIVASPRIWSHDGGAQARTPSQVAAVTPQPTGSTNPTPGPAAAEPAALTHRQSVLQQFSCFDCHGVTRGFLMPSDHASMTQAECENCHRPAAEPPPISLHDNGHQNTPSQDCGFCHQGFAAQARPAPTTQQNCYRCHGADTNKVIPADHANRSDATYTCIVCHQTQQVTVPTVPHRTAGWEQCTFCHGTGRLTPLDGAHATQLNERCLTCHAVVQPPAIYSTMHTLATARQGCTSCHAVGQMAPLPASHDSRSDVLCVLCHPPASADPPQVPHSVADNSACSSCHTTAKVGSLPYDHTTRTDQMCTVCHAERPGGAPPIPHALENRGACMECHAPSTAATPTRS